MREALLVTGTIAAIAVAGVGITAAAPIDTAVIVSLPTAAPLLIAPPAGDTPLAPLPAPANPPAVQPPSVPAVDPPVDRTAPARPIPVPPDDTTISQSPMLPPPSSESVTPTTELPAGPCPVGLVFDHVLGVCVSI